MTADTNLALSRVGQVALIELVKPPYNYLDLILAKSLADMIERLDADSDCRAVVLSARGKAFCAGTNFAGQASAVRVEGAINPLYAEAMRIMSCRKPLVAAVHGAAIGAGLGLAVAADFRVTCAEARFSANFSLLGLHPGFGLSVTLPRLVGIQKASMLFYTGKRIGGQEACQIGLADLFVEQDGVQSAAVELATQIAASAPIAVQSTRATLRRELLEHFRQAVAHESSEQDVQRRTADHKEGVAAASARREPHFTGS